MPEESLMTWMLIGVLIWVALAVPVAVLVGRSIRLADAKRTVAGPRRVGDVAATDPRPAAARPTVVTEQP